jgi:hypothetical protein
MLEELTVCEEVFHTAGGVAYADLITDGHRETWPIRSKRFRTWLRRCYYQATGAAPSAAAIRPALDLLEARAQFDAPEWEVSIRVAEHAGRLYLDLVDEHWRAVEIGADGWRVLGCPPVRFRRSPCASSTRSGDVGAGLIHSRTFYGHFGLVRLCRLGYDVPWVKA